MRAWARRRSAAEEGPTDHEDAPLVVSARVLDGEHLFLAVRGHAVPLALRSPAGRVDLDAETGTDRQGPLTTATILLEAYRGPDPRAEVTLEVGVRADRGLTPLRMSPDRAGPPGTSPTIDGPTTPDGQACWHLGDGPGLVLTRRPTAPVVPVLAVRGRDDTTEVVVGPGPGAQVEVRHEGRVTAVLGLESGSPGSDRTLRLGDLLDADPPADLTGGVLHVDAQPLARRRSHLGRPQRATELPPLPGGGLELRWTPAGHLALRPTGRAGRPGRAGQDGRADR